MFKALTATVFNDSDKPIYKVQVAWHLGTQGRGYSSIGMIMPGADEGASKELPEGADQRYFGAAVFFHDAADVCWRRRSDGSLDEIPAGQEPPHSW
jgi:hypothetical protein